MPEDVKPEDVKDDLNQSEIDQAEFDATFDSILDDDDTTADKGLDKDPNEDGKVKDAALGEGTKDPEPEPTPAGDKSGTKEKVDDPKPDTVDTDPDVTFWMNRARQAEADLAKEQQRTKSWDGRIGAANLRAEEAEAKVKELEAGTSGKTTDGPTPTASPADSDVEQVLEAFPEIKPIVDKFTTQIAEQQKIIEGLSQKEADPKPIESEPVPAKEVIPAADSKVEVARKAIVDAHPDFDQVMSSGKLEPWIAKQPDHIRPRLDEIYRVGTAAEVVSMTTTFKKDTGWKTPVSTDTDEKQKKLDAMKEVDSEGSGPPSPGPDKEDFDATAKEIGL